ncbi:MAG: pyruvate kinase [Christensenellales bacterium]
MRKTKIVATLGPATNNYKALKSIIQSGANVIRINFSHGNIEQHSESFDLIKQIRSELKVPVAIMVDTRGPEVRVKTFEGGSGILKKNSTFTLYGYDKEGTNEGVAVTEPICLTNLTKGNIILANDGLIKLSVLENKGYEVVCKVMSGGVLSNNKGLNFRNVPLNLPYIGKKDKDDLVWAFQNGCDMVSASFVNSADDIKELKKLMYENNYSCKIISKIESMSGIKNIEEILDISDGIMVARGDLGVEIPQSKLPKIQMDLIDSAITKGKTVIVATEMLESMITNPRPTRAETVDVANAVYNGASAVMLSAETAVGSYPDKAVKTMAEICVQAEKDVHFQKMFFETKFNTEGITDVVSHSATSCSFKLNTKAIVLYTSSGKTASMMTRFKPNAPIIAITDNPHTFNYLSLEWNVMPVLTKIDGLDIFDFATTISKELKLAKPNDLIIVTTGTTDKLNNVMKVCQVD